MDNNSSFSVTVNDHPPKMECTNCGEMFPTTQQWGNYIDDGISINVNQLGHYGGFTDNFPPKEKDYIAHLCHDCALILFEALPGFAEFAEVSGGHPNRNWLSDQEDGTNFKPCCQFAWCWNKISANEYHTYQANKDLEWVLMRKDIS